MLAGVGAAGAANNQGGGLGGYIARHKVMSLFTGLTAVFVTYQSTKAFYYWWYSDNNPCKTIKHPLIQKICLSDGIADNAEITHFLSVWDSNFGDQLASLQYQIRALPPEAKGKFDYLSQGYLPQPWDSTGSNTDAYTDYIRGYVNDPEHQLAIGQHPRKYAKYFTDVFRYCGSLEENPYGGITESRDNILQTSQVRVTVIATTISQGLLGVKLQTKPRREH